MRKITVNSAEKEALELAIKTERSPILVQRLHCILLASNLGLSVPKLSQHFGVTCKTIYHWFNLWEKGGIESLRHQKGQGAKKKLAPISSEDLKSLLEANNQNIKEVLAILAHKYQLNVSKKTLIRFLKI